jgi:hypothetical protein
MKCYIVGPDVSGGEYSASISVFDVIEESNSCSGYAKTVAFLNFDKAKAYYDEMSKEGYFILGVCELDEDKS